MAFEMATQEWPRPISSSEYSNLQRYSLVSDFLQDCYLTGCIARELGSFHIDLEHNLCLQHHSDGM